MVDYQLTIMNYLPIFVENFSGGHSEGETPVPFPNTAVKPLRVDGTALATGWESRSLPGIKLSSRLWWEAILFMVDGSRYLVFRSVRPCVGRFPV